MAACMHVHIDKLLGVAARFHRRALRWHRAGLPVEGVLGLGLRHHALCDDHMSPQECGFQVLATEEEAVVVLKGIASHMHGDGFSLGCSTLFLST